MYFFLSSLVKTMIVFNYAFYLFDNIPKRLFAAISYSERDFN